MPLQGYLRVDYPITMIRAADRIVRSYTGHRFAVPFDAHPETEDTVGRSAPKPTVHRYPGGNPGSKAARLIITELNVNPEYLGNAAVAVAWQPSPKDIAEVESINAQETT